MIAKTTIDEINIKTTDDDEKTPNSEYCCSENVLPKNLFAPPGISKLEIATRIIAKELIEPTTPTMAEVVKFDAINQNTYVKIDGIKLEMNTNNTLCFNESLNYNILLLW